MYFLMRVYGIFNAHDRKRDTFTYIINTFCRVVGGFTVFHGKIPARRLSVIWNSNAFVVLDLGQQNQYDNEVAARAVQI